ncbi:MAG: hypothetical protein V2J55_04610 [Candidatus Competibacteraceae bacterium]|nr:hypothetical protein [Candidatus Competibacteraceae bacterium]
MTMTAGCSLRQRRPRLSRPKPDTQGLQAELMIWTDVEMGSLHYGLLVERLGLLNRSHTRPQERNQVLAWVSEPMGSDAEAKPFSFQACLLWWNALQASEDRVDPAQFQELILNEANRWQRRLRLVRSR